MATPLNHVEIRMLVAQLGGWDRVALRITPHWRTTPRRGPVLLAPKSWTPAMLERFLLSGTRDVYGVHRYFPDTNTIKLRPFTGETS